MAKDNKNTVFKRGASPRRRVLDEVREFSTLIGTGTRVSGRLSGADNCIVNGTVEGDCRLEGALVLGESAHWHGNIEAAKAVVSGEVQGDITVSQRLELTPSARVTGRISSPALAMAEGAIHQGEIHMVTEAEVVRFSEKRHQP